MASTRFRWNGSELVDRTDGFDVPVYAAVSFLLREGTVVDYPGHLARFARWADEQGLKRPLDEFFDAVTEALPRTGDYFPRIDLTSRGELELHLRPVPPTSRTVIVSSAATDPREEPTIKGPDFGVLHQLKDAAMAEGAQEAIILDAQGRLVDASTSCLVWLRENNLFTPPADALRIQSITVGIVEDLARETGYSVETQWTTPAELEGAQLWILNALHGIRAVSSWVNGPTFTVNEALLDQFRDRYEAQFVTVHFESSIDS